MTANLYALLRARFPANRGAPCYIVPGGRTWSYGDVEHGAQRIAALLLARGVRPGDRIVCQAPKSVETILLYLATVQTGAVYVPLNHAYTETEVRYFLEDADPALFVTDPPALLAEAAGMAPHQAIFEAAPDDLAALIYTSGTTGRSKGAMLSHANLSSNAETLHAAWGFLPGDALLHALPIFHVHGLFVALHTMFLNGGPTIWLERFDETAVLAALPQASVMMGVPTFYTRLLAHPGFTREAVAHMRLFISGSAPLLDATFAEFEARTGMRILERYGMSEAGMIASNTLTGERVAGSVGYALPGVEVRIAGGEVGTIEIRGPNVFGGYWRMPDKTGEAFTVDGWFATGDVGRLDVDGRLWISGRATDLIISGGFNVYPKEIELLLDTLPGVTESAVIGVPHPDYGEAVVAIVTGEGGEPETLAAMRGRLAGFKTPKRILFVDDLPRNAMGKVQKAQLRETYADLFAR